MAGLRLAALGVVVLAALAIGSYAVAGDGKKKVDDAMNGYLEVPAVSSTGSGRLTLRIDDDADLIHYTLTYADLEGATTSAAHIHLGQRSVAGGISAFLCGGGDKPACPPDSATITDVIDPADVIGPSGQGIAAGEFEELVAAIRAGRTYGNVHTDKHPGGEIRGQLNDNNQRDD